MPCLAIGPKLTPRIGCMYKRAYTNPVKREYDFSEAKRGAVVPARKGKTRITIRIDHEVLAWFRDQVERAGGGSYQSLINEVLRQRMCSTQEPLEKALRRVIREELRRVS